jgi:glucose-1-phosphate cytidylyltransferase
MKAVILAGGLGTRISEETHLKPKPMIEIGGKPILWHILKLYSHYGINDFIICCGYKGYVIKEYFANYFLHMSDVTFHMKLNTMEVRYKGAAVLQGKQANALCGNNCTLSFAVSWSLRTSLPFSGY